MARYKEKCCYIGKHIKHSHQITTANVRFNRRPLSVDLS